MADQNTIGADDELKDRAFGAEEYDWHKIQMDKARKEITAAETEIDAAKAGLGFATSEWEAQMLLDNVHRLEDEYERKKGELEVLEMVMKKDRFFDPVKFTGIRKKEEVKEIHERKDDPIL